jgi:hypothetical protein
MDGHRTRRHTTRNETHFTNNLKQYNQPLRRKKKDVNTCILNKCVLFYFVQLFTLSVNFFFYCRYKLFVLNLISKHVLRV